MSNSYTITSTCNSLEHNCQWGDVLVMTLKITSTKYIQCQLQKTNHLLISSDGWDFGTQSLYKGSIVIIDRDKYIVFNYDHK